MAFPNAVDCASDTWVDKIIATTVIGLVCWLISGIVHLAALYKRKSRKARKWWDVVAKILLVSVTLIVLLHSLAGILFLSIDASDIPQRVNTDADACSPTTSQSASSNIQRYGFARNAEYAQARVSASSLAGGRSAQDALKSLSLTELKISQTQISMPVANF